MSQGEPAPDDPEDQRPRRDAAATRQRILESALKIFSEQAFDATTTREIAAAADVNHAMIRYYFSSKEQLWRAVMTHQFERMAAEMDQPTPLRGLRYVEGFKEFVRRYVRYCARHPEHPRMSLQESIRGGPRLDWITENFIGPRMERLTPYVQGLVESGDLPDMSPISLLYIFGAAAQAPYIRAQELHQVMGANVRSPEAVEAHVEAVVAMIFGERRKKGPA